MATLTQESVHAIKWAFTKLLLIAQPYWLGMTDVVRSWWWRAWGYDPKTPEFHISQMNCESFARSVEFNYLFVTILEAVFGNKERTLSWELYLKYRRFDYMDYRSFHLIGDLVHGWEHSHEVLSWILEVEKVELDSVLFLLLSRDELMRIHPQLKAYLENHLKSTPL